MVEGDMQGRMHTQGGGDHKAGNLLSTSRDVFGTQIADGQSNELDIAAHYPFSDERWHLFRNGTRQLPSYGSITGFNDAPDVYELSPAQSETLSMETTERPRYTVQYELEDTFALSISRALEAGDRIRVGAYDNEDGWFYEHNDTHDIDQIDVVTLRNSSEVLRETHRLGEPLTTFTRLGIETPWYDVGRQLWTQSYSKNGVQQNPVIASTSRDNGKGPRTGNLPVQYEIVRGASSSPITLNVGSVGVNTKGDTDSTNRSKEFVKNITVNTTGAWVPIFAVRIDPEQYMTNCQLRRIEALKFTGNSDIEMIAKMFDPSNVTDGGGNPLVDADFGVPDEINTQNSAIQTTEAVEQVVDNTGTLQTSMQHPGGYQIGFSTLTTDKKSTAAAQSPGTKAQIVEDDIMVVLVETGASGDIKWRNTIEEDW